MIKKVANSITPMIRMEEDCCSNHISEKLLDLAVWVQGTMVKHQFYKKSMTTKNPIMARSAFPPSMTRAVLVQEFMRRLRNCSPDLTWEEKGVFLKEMAK